MTVELVSQLGQANADICGEKVEERAGLIVQNLTKYYGDHLAVDGVSISVQTGEALVLLGPSGCGKTSMLRTIAGLETANGGTIEIEGEVMVSGRRSVPAEKRPIGMVFQGYALWPQMRLIDIVAFPIRARGGVNKREARAAAEKVLATVGLTGFEQRFPTSISGGQQQRVALARAISSRPKLLLMDEPLSALDRNMREKLRIDIREFIRSSDVTCVYVTHDQEEAMAIGDHVAVMEHGKVVDYGRPEEIHRRPATASSAVFLGATNTVCATAERAVHGGLWRARADIGIVHFRPGPGVDVHAGDEIDCYWHPESMAPAQSDVGDSAELNIWPAEIRSCIYLGHEYEIVATLEHREFRLRSPIGVTAGVTYPVAVAASSVFGYPQASSQLGGGNR